MKNLIHPHVMIDNETMGTRPNSIILSIGAVRFAKDGPHERSIEDTFYAVLDIEEQRSMGRTEDASTMKWWSERSDEAREVLTTTDRRPVKEALSDLWDFIYGFGTNVEGKTHIWGNGSDFDNPQIVSLFDMYDFDLPWDFWRNRCFRTWKSEFGHLTKEPERKGVYHNALDDALHQVKHFQLICDALKSHVVLKV